MKLHIVMVVLNCRELTENAVNSIQTKEDYVLHIVDQASTDNTRSYCADLKLQRENKFFYHRYEEIHPLSEAWNWGIRESLKDSECEYIFVPNNDVIFHKTTIDNLIKGIDELRYVMVTGSNVQPDMSLDEMKNKDEHGSWEHDKRKITSFRDEGPDFSCFMIKSDFVEKIGYFDENFPVYCEDQDMHIRIIKAGEHAKRLSTAPYYHIASQTIQKNPKIAQDIQQKHRVGLAYYREKWQFDHHVLLEGKGYENPYNMKDKGHRYWKGVEKYEA